MSREYKVELHFLNGKIVTAVFPAESASEAIKRAFGGKLNCTHIIADIANSNDKIGYSVSALAWVEVTEWKELVKKHTI